MNAPAKPQAVATAGCLIVTMALAALALARPMLAHGNDGNASPEARAVEAAMEDAVRRTGLGRGDLQVVRVEAVTWPDGSLGCPRPDAIYTQAPVPGYRIEIRNGKRRLQYHANTKGLIIFCPTASITDPLPLEIR